MSCFIFQFNFSQSVSPVFIFLEWGITTEAMGILRFAGATLSQSETVNAGAKTAECTTASR